MPSIETTHPSHILPHPPWPSMQAKPPPKRHSSIASPSVRDRGSPLARKLMNLIEDKAHEILAATGLVRAEQQGAIS